MTENHLLLEVLLRGPHESEAARREVAAVLRCPAADVGWASGPGGSKFTLDHALRADGFRTQVTLSLDAGLAPPVKTSLDLARALAARLGEDALVLADPTVIGMEPFHGLLARPDGRVYRVPLRELASGGMGIDEKPAAWQEWILRA